MNNSTTSGSGPAHRGIGLPNTIQSEVAPCLPLPSLPVFCGAVDPDLRFFDEPSGPRGVNGSRSLNRREILTQSSKIAELLRETDVSYLNFREGDCHLHNDHAHPIELYSQVLEYNPLAFEYVTPDPVKDQASGDTGFERQLSDSSVPVVGQFKRDLSVTHSQQDVPSSSSLKKQKVKHKGKDDLISPVQLIAAELQGFPVEEHVSGGDAFVGKLSEHCTTNAHQVQRDFGGPHIQQEASTSSLRKSKNKKKGLDNLRSVEPVAADLQDATIRKFCLLLEDLCSKAEIPTDDREETEWLSLPVSDINMLVNEITSICSKKFLHLVPVDILVRLLRVLDHQIHRAEGLSVSECEYSDSNVFSSIFCALESIHASLAIMAHDNMPKQLYKEEMIERILEFSRHQVGDVMSAFDPSYRAMYKPSENGPLEGDEDDELDADMGSASKKRRSVKSAKVKKSTFNRVSGAMSSIFQKLCTILGLLRDLLLIERLSDSCILQLLRTSFTTFLVDNIQLLQLKAISLISGIFYSYTQHRTYIIEEVIQIFWKLPFSKRALRAYYLPDEEQRQIQMVTALFIQLVHGSANLPEQLRRESMGNLSPEVSVDSNFASKCNEAVIDTCCNFWSRVLQRLTSVKTQDASEVKVMMENLIIDLLTTLNLPEYPASAPILEVLCVLLLQNAGLKSKDISARSMAIDLLGTIATRLKHDAVICRREKYWILQELVNEECEGRSYPKDACSICMDRKVDKALYKCQSCQRLFHADCMGIREHGIPDHSWHCQFCLCERQLLFLQSYCKSQNKDNESRNRKQSDKSESSAQIKKAEVAQQMVLNYLQDASSTDDGHLFVRWFYLCLWYKENPKSQNKFQFYLARLKSKAIVRDPGMVSSPLTRDSVKRITLTLGQNNSFSRGFDKILHMLLASLRENSPVIRAKALRAVSVIVEADPEVLGDKRVQLAVEGRFCDSAISVREAALELVGRHIASHPEVGVKYFEKVAERIKDTGVSVRKRAIKIIRDMCTSNANFSGFTDACIEIISRVNDDESSIQDLVCKTFNEFWFEESSGFQLQYSRDGCSVPLEVAKKTEQIVEMLRRMPNHQLLVTVIRRNLALDFFPQAAKAAGINPVSLAMVRRRCELMCTCLLERILQVEEMNSAEGEDVPTLPYVLALHAFCVVDPSLCMPNSDPAKFLITLQPYLKTQADNRAVAQLLESIIYIVDSVVSLMQKFPESFVEELEQDLKQMIVRHSFLTVVHACIKCLCSVSKKAGSGAAVVDNLIQLFFKRLDAQVTENKQQVGRSLFCLGLLIRYGYSLVTASENKSIDITSSINLFSKYLSMEDLSIKVRSLQALGYVLIARPDYMLERDIEMILETTLSEGCNVRLKMQMLQNLYEYLLDAESQLGMDKPGGDVAFDSLGGSSVPVAAGAGDTNICGGIVQLYWDKILGRCLDGNEQVRQSALKIVEIVLRQGLVHPITCVPYLIALETDPLEVNQNLAHHLLMNMNEKYPAFFESRLGDGLQLSFIFMQSTFGNFPDNNNNAKFFGNLKWRPDGSSFNQARLGVSRIYKLIRGNRVSRNKFMSSIIRKFDNPSFNDAAVPFLTYCTEILALLPFTSPDEPLYLIYAINRIVQVRTGSIEANMKALCSQLAQKDSRKVNHENGAVKDEPGQPAFNFMSQVDLNGSIQEEPTASHVFYNAMPIDLNGANQQPIPCHTHAETNVYGVSSLEACIFAEDGKKMIQVECLNATALQLLLKLKRHLKIVYGLNDARCQAYSPTEPLKHGEPLSRQNIPFDISDITPTQPSTYQDLSQRYQEFKNALREDTVDYSIYTANIKRKRPPGRRGRAARGAGEDEEDDDDDEDYWGSGRRISGSGRRGRGRQR